MSLRDLDLQEAYKAIDNVATGRIPSLFYASTISQFQNQQQSMTLALVVGYLIFLYLSTTIKVSPLEDFIKGRVPKGDSILANVKYIFVRTNWCNTMLIHLRHKFALTLTE